MPKLSTPLFRLARKLCRFRGAGPFCVSLGPVLVWGLCRCAERKKGRGLERVKGLLRFPVSLYCAVFGVGRTISSQERGTAYPMDGVQNGDF